MGFESAMERQRHTQEVLDDETIQKVPRFKTKLPIERNAVKIYTRTIFMLIQDELNSAVYDCHQVSEAVSDGFEVLTIKELREVKPSKSKKKYNFGETQVQSKKDRTKIELRFKVFFISNNIKFITKLYMIFFTCETYININVVMVCSHEKKITYKLDRFN